MRPACTYSLWGTSGKKGFGSGLGLVVICLPPSTPLLRLIRPWSLVSSSNFSCTFLKPAHSGRLSAPEPASNMYQQEDTYLKLELLQVLVQKQQRRRPGLPVQQAVQPP